MNSQLLVRCIQRPQQYINNIIRISTRCVHKCAVCYQDSPREPPSMPEYMKKRQSLLESNPVKFSTGKAKKWDVKKMAASTKFHKRPLHRGISVNLSLTVLFLYLIFREENDMDEHILFDFKTAEEYQAILEKLKK